MVQISVPAQASFVGVVRLAVASLARSAGMDEERVDELKIALSEACTNATLAAEDGSATQLRVRWQPNGKSVAIEVEDELPDRDPQVPAAPADDFASRRQMSEDLLRSLADDYALTPTPTGHITRLTFSL